MLPVASGVVHALFNRSGEDSKDSGVTVPKNRKSLQRKRTSVNPGLRAVNIGYVERDIAYHQAIGTTGPFVVLMHVKSPTANDLPVFMVLSQSW